MAFGEIFWMVGGVASGPIDGILAMIWVTIWIWEFLEVFFIYCCNSYGHQRMKSSAEV